jgi:hypothetical protein
VRLAALPVILLLGGVYEIVTHWRPSAPCARLFSDADVDGLAGRTLPAAKIEEAGDRCVADWQGVRVELVREGTLDAIAAAWRTERGFVSDRSVGGIGRRARLASFAAMGTHQRRLLAELDGGLLDVSVSRSGDDRDLDARLVRAVMAGVGEAEPFLRR